MQINLGSLAKVVFFLTLTVNMGCTTRAVGVTEGALDRDIHPVHTVTLLDIKNTLYTIEIVGNVSGKFGADYYSAARIQIRSATPCFSASPKTTSLGVLNPCDFRGRLLSLS